MMEPDAGKPCSGLCPRFFRPPYSFRSRWVPKLSVNSFRRIAAARISHQAGFCGGRSRLTPVFTNSAQTGLVTPAFLSSSAALRIARSGNAGVPAIVSYPVKVQDRAVVRLCCTSCAASRVLWHTTLLHELCLRSEAHEWKASCHILLMGSVVLNSYGESAEEEPVFCADPFAYGNRLIQPHFIQVNTTALVSLRVRMRAFTPTFRKLLHWRQ